MKLEFLNPKLTDITVGSRLAFIRKIRKMTQDDVAEIFELEGDRKGRTICRYEKNERIPRDERLEELANIYKVSIATIKLYDFTDPVDIIYNFMWLDELYKGCEFNFDHIIYSYSEYNMQVLKGIKKWQEMKAKRDNNEISRDEYLEWMFHFKIDGDN